MDIVQVTQKGRNAIENIKKNKKMSIRFIHIQKSPKQDKSDLYTKLSTLSTDFLTENGQNVYKQFQNERFVKF